MYFSARLVEGLVVELAGVNELDPDVVHNLIYHLKLPGRAVPRCIAEVIADRPTIGRTPNNFPARLAFGVIDDGLQYYDDEVRYRDQTKVCRQVEQIRLELERISHPVQVIEVFGERFAQMVFASAAASDLADCEREISKAELSTLVERIIESVMMHEEAARHLLAAVARRLKHMEKLRLKERVADAVEQGLENIPWEDREPRHSLFNLNEPVRFRRSLYEHSLFPGAARDTVDFVAEICSH